VTSLVPFSVTFDAVRILTSGRQSWTICKTFVARIKNVLNTGFGAEKISAFDPDMGQTSPDYCIASFAKNPFPNYGERFFSMLDCQKTKWFPSLNMSWKETECEKQAVWRKFTCKP
jgi:hypothetical protein